jgi:hypothetical protein
MMELNQVSVTFSASARQDCISSATISLLKQIGAASDNRLLIITSTARTPNDQARIMFDNCIKLGIASQYKLYGQNGDKVIKVFEAGIKVKDFKRDDVIAKMETKIREIGPGKVSKHCADPSTINVVDIPFSSISDKGKFRKAIEKHSPDPIARFLEEGENKCFHLEILKRRSFVDPFFFPGTVVF